MKDESVNVLLNNEFFQCPGTMEHLQHDETQIRHTTCILPVQVADPQRSAAACTRERQHE